MWRRRAQGIGKFLGSTRPLVTVTEGEEPAEFWEAVGGEGDYVKIKDDVEHPDPRLFQVLAPFEFATCPIKTAQRFGLACRTSSQALVPRTQTKLKSVSTRRQMSNNLGYFRVDEVFRFSQDDLISDDVFMLDTFTEVYVWVGNDSSKEEKLGAIRAALEYVAKMAEMEGRDKDTPCLKARKTSRRLYALDSAPRRVAPRRAVQSALIKLTKRNVSRAAPLYR